MRFFHHANKRYIYESMSSQSIV